MSYKKGQDTLYLGLIFNRVNLQCAEIISAEKNIFKYINSTVHGNKFHDVVVSNYNVEICYTAKPCINLFSYVLACLFNELKPNNNSDKKKLQRS